MAMQGEEQTEASGSSSVAEVEQLMAEVGLREEDLDDVAFDEKEAPDKVHDVSDLYAHLVPALAAKIGEVLFTEPLIHDFTGNFYRVWVRINVHKPVKNVVSMIRDSKMQIYRVRYERLPDWCVVYGHLGHVYKEHGDGVHLSSALYFKDLCASSQMRVGTDPGGGHGRGRRGARHGDGMAGRPSVPTGNEVEDANSDEVMVEADDNRKRL
ncbi:hypothetical protein D1007_45755 [Hordeum vulgare]|nr:hypothetical protein D1007_45755 [Hordeum vulgare]